MKIVSSLLQFTDFMAEPVLFMESLAKEADISSVKMGPKRFVFTFDPDLAQEILIKKADIYKQNRTVFDRIQPVTGKKGIVQLSGKESQDARLKSRPMFNTHGLESVRGSIESFCDDMLNRLGSRGHFDVTDEMTLLILQTACSILLGVESKELATQIGNKFQRLNYLCGLRMRSLVPAPLFIPTLKNREIRNLQSEIRSLIIQHVANGKNVGVPKAFSDDDNLIDHCMTFLFAGHETTASSLAFTLLLLAQHPQYQDLIAQGDQEMTMAVYKESLRLFPPAYMLAREAASEDILGKFRIQKSDHVIVGVSHLHRNAKYFDRPNEFYPERFLSKQKHNFAFIPFGVGNKSCVGERLAYLEAGIILKKICHKYKFWSLTNTILSEPLITLHPLSNQNLYYQERKI
jgi:cytochrome P450